MDNITLSEDFFNTPTKRKDSLQNQANINYNAVVTSGVDMVQLIKKKRLRGVFVADSRLHKIETDEIDDEGNILQGSISFRLVLADYSYKTSIPIIVTFSIRDDVLTFNETFRDNLNRTYALTTEQVKKLLQHG